MILRGLVVVVVSLAGVAAWLGCGTDVGVVGRRETLRCEKACAATERCDGRTGQCVPCPPGSACAPRGAGGSGDEPSEDDKKLDPKERKDGEGEPDAGLACDEDGCPLRDAGESDES